MSKTDSWNVDKTPPPPAYDSHQTPTPAPAYQPAPYSPNPTPTTQQQQHNPNQPQQSYQQQQPQHQQQPSYQQHSQPAAQPPYQQPAGAQPPYQQQSQPHQQQPQHSPYQQQPQYPPQSQPGQPPYQQPPPSNYQQPVNSPYPVQPPNNYPPPQQQYGGPAPNSAAAPNRFEKFRQVCAMHEISDLFAQKLRVLEGFDVVLIADDSGSMLTPLAATSPFAPSITRWDELKTSVKTIIDIASTMDSNGIDIYFLNRPPLLNITNAAMVEQPFSQPPSGFTPIADAINRVLQAKQAVLAEKKLLIVILTDGEPTDTRGQVSVPQLEQALMYRPQQCFTTFVACTDDLQVMEYLNGWDKKIPRLDVVDDYRSEQREILAVRGPSFPFSHGDYVVKLLLGSIVPDMDRLDEAGGPMSYNQQPAYQQQQQAYPPQQSYQPQPAYQQQPHQPYYQQHAPNQSYPPMAQPVYPQPPMQQQPPYYPQQPAPYNSYPGRR